jgi:hypothetical protein
MWAAADVVADQRWIVAEFFLLFVYFLCRAQKPHGKEMDFFKVHVFSLPCLNTAQQSAFAVRATKSARQRAFAVQKI